MHNLTPDYVAAQKLPFSAYEGNWHSTNDLLMNITVTLINVLSYDAGRGTITFSYIGRGGSMEKASGSIENYYPTPEAAWAAEVENLKSDIESNQNERDSLNSQIAASYAVLARITKE